MNAFETRTISNELSKTKFVYPSFLNAHHRCYFYSTYPPTIADWLWRIDKILWAILIEILRYQMTRYAK